MLKILSSIALFAPLFGSIISFIFNKSLGRKFVNTSTIFCIFLSLISAFFLYFLINNQQIDFNVLNLGNSFNLSFAIGFLLNKTAIIMAIMVCFISILVHIYSIGYMRSDEGYAKFFAYISFFTFSMLLIVFSNNLLGLYIGWECVGLASYLLIGFWYEKSSATKASLKAFVMNRIGDVGFILGIGLLFAASNSLNYLDIFNNVSNINPSLINLACILLFIGAMGKSAQIPLHTWLPDSMEGPTPISALIHAATMVTAGIYMVIRLAPLYMHSTWVLSLILIVGSTTAFFMGILAIVETDIKKIIAYSTLSQLGYMVAGLGVLAFNSSFFHLITHAFFKSLLFLAAGAVIIAMQHEQDIFKMTNLKKYLPVTYFAFLIGALSMSAIPPFAGFYSKEAIISFVESSDVVGSSYAYICLLLTSFVTAFYIFRLFFIVFHRKNNQIQVLQKVSKTMLIPIIILSIFAFCIGFLIKNLFVSNTIQYTYLPVVFSILGILVAWIAYILLPGLPQVLSMQFSFIYRTLRKNYYFDFLYDFIIANKFLSTAAYALKYMDERILNKEMLEGTGKSFILLSNFIRKLQSGSINIYALFLSIVLLFSLIYFLILA